MKKAIIYARVSSKEQEKEGFSIPAQLKLLNDYAVKNDLVVVKEFVDTETAKKAGRSGFSEMLRFIKKNKSVKTILVEKTDRLYRNFKDYVLVDESEYEIHLVKENSILSEKSRSHEKFIHGIKVLMAKNYIDNLSEETKKGLREKAAQGYYPGKAPLGYKNVVDGSGKKVIVVEKEKAAYVKRAFKLYATGSYSLEKLNDKLYEEGFVNHLGKKAPKSYMGKLLTNIFYVGAFEFEGVRYDNAKHEPLISLELFYRVQNQMRDPRKARTRNMDFPYTNLIRCGECGCYLTAEIKKEKYIYYHCTGAKGGTCKKVYVRQEAIESRILDTIKSIVISKELADKIRDGMREIHEKKNEYSAESSVNINKQIDMLNRRIEQVYIDKLDGHITNEFWKERTALWHAQRDELRVKQTSLDKKNDEFYELSNSLLEFCENAYPAFLEANSKEKRMILNLMVSNFSFKGRKLSIELNDTFGTIANNGILLNGALTGTKLELFVNNLYNTISAKKPSITPFSLNEFKKAV